MIRPSHQGGSRPVKHDQPETQLTAIDVIASSLEPVLPDLGGISSPDGAVTLMLCDIADAATLEDRLGEERWERLLTDHQALAEQLVAGHDGEVARTARDGFLAVFNSAHGALHAAGELQRAFVGFEEPDLALRMGAHTGFVIGGTEQLLGRNVVLASRIAAKARGGEILVSSAVKQYTENDPSFHFEERGDHHFKGVLGEHALYAVAWR
jgi:class 3 adenylate cyclase